MKDVPCLLDAIRDIHQILLNEESRDKAIQSSLVRLGEATEMDRISIYEADTESGDLRRSFQWEKIPNRVLEMSGSGKDLNLVEAMPGVSSTFLMGQDFNAYQLPSHPQEQRFLSERGMNAALAYAIVVRKKFWGLLLLESGVADPEWSAEQLSLLQSISSSFGVSFLRWASEEKLQQSNHELNAAVDRARKLVIESERANASKGEFLARMSHEIRTPMNGILGMARLLSYQEMPAEQREHIDIILQSGEMLLHIINDILDFSKIEAGKLQISEVGFDLHSMLESVDSLLGPRSQEKHISYRSEIAEDVPRNVMGDSVRIRQILINLIGNAIKFTSDGEITVRTQCLEQDEKKARLKFIVSDTGCGISTENIEYLFEEFNQVDGSSIREFEGAGLGLAIVRRLLNLMNGDVKVESELGKGSSFIVTLELLKTHNIEAVEGVSEFEEVLKGRKVLVVDDNPNNLKVMAGFLDQWKCEHTETTDPFEALNLLDEAHRAGKPYLCAVIDMMMPQWDGVQLAQRIRNKPELAQTLLMVMLSSVDIREQEAELQKAGFFAVMQKPVNSQQLHGVLANALYQHDRSKAAILIVDDDPNTLECSSRILQREFDVFTASTTAEAEKFLQGNHGIDLLFCDHEMPGELGMDFCKRLQSQGSSIVRVLITGYVDQDFLLEAINSQALFRYLVKPVRQELYLKTAHEALEEGRKRSQEKIKIAISDTRTVEEGVMASPVKTAPEAPQTTPRILLAEDNPVNQKVASSFLKRLGVECEVANNGKVALDKLKQERFDAVLMDLHMPEMDGLEATRALREWEEGEGRERLPVIALTADAIKGDREKCLEAGMDDYITKPVKVKSLQEALAKVVSLSAP